MRQATTNDIRSRHLGGLAIFAILALASVTAAPAQAGGNEFDDGFQDQLGRLVATEVFQLGRWVLTGGPHYAYAYDHHEYHEPRHRGHGHYRDRHHARKHRRHDWRRHHGHKHGYGDPCNVETHERVRRNRYGEVVEYERHERRYRDRYAHRW